MDWIAIARHFGKADDVRRVDGFFYRFCHPDRQVFEKYHLQRQHFRTLRVIAAAADCGRHRAKSKSAVKLAILASYRWFEYVPWSSFVSPSAFLP
jgi:hypothetical protein